MAKKGVLKNGKNKKLHSKLIQQKKNERTKGQGVKKTTFERSF